MLQKKYTLEFKEQAIALVKTGRRVVEVAAELGIHRGMLYQWIADEGKSVGAKQATGEEGEAKKIRRLEKELFQVKLENEILKKAAIILGSTQSMGAAK